jgi:hypothetical protein
VSAPQLKSDCEFAISAPTATSVTMDAEPNNKAAIDAASVILKGFIAASRR